MDIDGSPISASVLMTADTVGGVWSYALELARALEQRGISVALATMGAPVSEAQRTEARSISSLQLFESDFKLEWMENPWQDVRRSGEWLLNLEKKLRPDFIHLNSYAHGSLPWSAPTLVVGHSCVLSWWQAVHHEPAPAEWDLYASQVSSGLRRTKVVAAPTDAMVSALESHYPLPSIRLRIPNGCDPSSFVPDRKEPLVLTAGRFWDDAKNLQAVDRVAPCLAWPVFAIGEERGFEHVTELGRQSRVCVARWMGRASIFALPARYEPFGLAPLEAALAGCALVLGDIPSLREVWGPAALFVDPEDHESLKAALNSLIQNPDLGEDLAGKARSRALHYSSDRMADGYVTAYKLTRLVSKGI